jgi:hypothetical protein
MLATGLSIGGINLLQHFVKIALKQAVLDDAALLKFTLGMALAISAVTFPASCNIFRSVASMNRFRRVSQSCIVIGICRSAISSATSKKAVLKYLGEGSGTRPLIGFYPAGTLRVCGARRKRTRQPEV